MSAKGNTFINDLLTHIFENGTVPLIGDATGLLGAGTVGNLYLSLHNAANHRRQLTEHK